MDRATRDRLKATAAAQKVRKAIPRLPDGSTFEAKYNAETQTWRGTLTVPGALPFTQTCKGVFGLLTKLDQCYRRSLRLPPEK